MKPKDIHEGDLVSVEEWDRSVRPKIQLGSPATIIRVTPVRHCESGCMVTIRGTSGRKDSLDAGWLEPWTGDKPLVDEA